MKPRRAYQRFALTLAFVFMLLFNFTATPQLVTAASTVGVAFDAGRTSTSIADVPIQAQYAISGSIGADQAGYHAIQNDENYLFENLEQGLSARFTQTGVNLQSEGLTWEMGLQAWGYQDALLSTDQLAPVAQDNHIEYQRSGLNEWYINGPLGMQQGFTVFAPPTKGSGLLTLQFSLPENVKAQINDLQTGLTFSEANGNSLLTYSDLLAYDAANQSLPAHLEIDLTHKTLHIIVDDKNAQYPIAIDPWVQIAKLTASDNAASDEFGWAVAIDGDTIVVGAHKDGEAAGGDTDAGSAYVFVKPGTGWATTSAYAAKLTASDWAKFDEFGTSVAIGGNTIVVGVPSKNKAYVFDKPGGGWSGALTEDANLTSSSGGGRFGSSVAVDGDTIVVGAPTAANYASWGTGRAYVFVRPGGGWSGNLTESALLEANYGTSSVFHNGDKFGASVAISGDTVAVGAPDVDLNGSNSGLVYIFEKPFAGWSGTLNDDANMYPKVPNSVNVYVQLGFSVDMDGDTLVAGAYGDSLNNGAAYVFEKGAGWSTGAGNRTARLSANDIVLLDEFGYSVSIDGDTIVVSSKWDDDKGIESGSAYIFEKPASGWVDMTQTEKVTASDGAAYDYLGHTVSISGDTVVAGAPFHDLSGAGSQGAAYIFARPPAPEIDVQRPAGTSIADGGIDAQGILQAGTVSRTYTVENTGLATLNVTNITSASASNVTVNSISTTSFTVAASGTATFDVQFTPTADGAFSFELDITNDDTNEGNYDITVSGTYDGTAPTVSMSSTASDPTNLSPIPVTVTFSESVTGFTAADITPGNGTVDNFAGSGASYTFDLTPTANGSVTADIAASVAQDSAGNDNTAATQFSRTYDTTAPTVSMSSTASDPTNLSPIPVTVTFNKSVTGFTAADITPGNGTVDNFAGSGASYTFDLTPTANGSVTADIAASVAQDSAGNDNTAATQFSRTYDTTAPTVSMSSAASDPTNLSPIPVTVSFSKSVTGFTAADITPGNGTVDNFVGSGASYTFDLTPTANGSVTADIAASVAQDSAGNDNTAATQFSRNYDTLWPTIISTTLLPTYIGAGPISFTVTFSEDVNNPAGDTDPDDVTNPANYRLINKGTNGVLETASCAVLVGGDDSQVTVNGVIYSPNTATVTLASALPVGSYRLFACGTTSIVDLALNPIGGGVDYTFDFMVGTSGSGSGDNARSLPRTGFAPFKITRLPAQPAELDYTEFGSLWFEIPSLGVRQNIVGVPQTSFGWDVTWLGNDIGYLNGTAFPTWEGNSVITGHVTDSNGLPGPFANLTKLRYGDQLIVHLFDEQYIFEVRNKRLVHPETTAFAFEHLEDHSYLTLITCQGYDSATDSYRLRRVVRAVLVGVK